LQSGTERKTAFIEAAFVSERHDVADRMRDARIEPRRGNTACLEVRPVIGARNPCARASHLMAVCAGPRNCAFKRKWSGCPKKVDPDKLNSGGCRHEWSRLGKHDSTVLPRSGLLATHSCPSARRSHRSRAAIRSRTVSVHSTAMNGFSDNPYAKHSGQQTTSRPWYGIPSTHPVFPLSGHIASIRKLRHS
jgi:hypothetical protein